MPDDSPRTSTLSAIDWRAAFPFTHVFRSFRVAIHPSKMFLALVALILLYTGGRILDGLWPDSYSETRIEAAQVYSQDILPTAPDIRFGTSNTPDLGATYNERVGPFVPFFDYEAAQVNHLARAVLYCDPAGVFTGIDQFLAVGPSVAFTRHPVFFAIFTLWFLLIWSVFGGAIARIAAVHVARDEKIAIRQALRFSTGKLLSFLFAPLIPLIIIGVIALLVAVGGLLNYITPGGVGQVIVSLAFGLTLLVGFVMTLVLFGTVGGFSLMYPTIAVEGSDSFDAISRSFSYVYARPWRMAFYTAVAVIYGALTYLFVRLFLWTMLALVHHFESGFLRDNSAAFLAWQSMWPPPRFDRLPYDIDYHALTPGIRAAAGILSFWLYLAISLMGAFVISFYFSANTIIYYLMRQEVDATELDDVFLDQADEEFLEIAPTEAAAPAPIAPAPIAPVSPASGLPITPISPVSANVGPEHVPPQPTPGPQTDNPPGNSLTLHAPSDAPTLESSRQDPQAEKKPTEGA